MHTRKVWLFCGPWSTDYAPHLNHASDSAAPMAEAAVDVKSLQDLAAAPSLPLPAMALTASTSLKNRVVAMVLKANDPM